MPTISPRAKSAELGLLVLRGAGLFLLLTFGWMKFSGLLRTLLAGAPLATSGLAPLIKGVGFPFPGAAYLFVSLSESLGAALVAIGFLTRAAAACLALSMVGAFYFSLRTQEEPLRAALYVTIFLAIALLGPGRFSIDRVLGIEGRN